MPEWLAAPLFLFAGAIVSGIVSVLVAKMTSATQKKTAEIESRGPDWKSFTEEMRQQNAATKEELNGKIDRLRGQVAELRTEVDMLRGKYRKAMVRLAAWHRRHPDDPLVESLPAELWDDFPGV